RAVADVMMSYLDDVGYCGFGVDAAYVLRQIWRTQRSLAIGQTESEPVLSSRRQRVVARADRTEPQHRYAEPLLKAIDDLATPPSEQSQRHALLLAIVAFSMPCGERSATIRALLNLPQPSAAKQGLLRVLAEAGELLPGDLVFDGIRGLLEE